MAMVQVILHGIPGGSVHDTAEDPIYLRFGESNDYDAAEWAVPTFPGLIPGYMLSELRVEQGRMTIFVEAENFSSGPHAVDWVRSGYPRGKSCSLIDLKSATGKMAGVSVSIVEGAVVVQEINLGV